jgi:hypothetical protein
MSRVRVRGKKDKINIFITPLNRLYYLYHNLTNK